MKVATMVQLLTAGAVAAATVVAPAAAAQAATVLERVALGSFASPDRAEAVGRSGTAAGLWTAHEVTPGYTQHILFVDYTPTTSLRDSWTHVYTAPAGTECAQLGESGTAHQVWSSYRCAAGDRGNYLFVR